MWLPYKSLVSASQSWTYSNFRIGPEGGHSTLLLVGTVTLTCQTVCRGVTGKFF